MNDEQIKLLVSKFLKGQCTPTERKIVLDWWEDCLLYGEPSKFLSRSEEQALKDAMFASIQESIRAHEGAAPQKVKQVKTIFWQPARVYMAAASVVFLLAVVLYYNWSISFVNISTAYGETREVKLPDNSVVVLNGNSSLRYKNSWDENARRDVWLCGEAYFSVVHTVRHTPFTVHTRDELTIQVLGTKFNVSNTKKETEVVLNEGKVKLQHRHSTYIMKPNEVVRYSEDQPRFVSHVEDASGKVSWKDHLLVFEDETINSIVNKLKERYGLKIVIENEKFGQERFTGSIPTDSVVVFIDKVKKLYSVEVAEEENVYTIR